MHFDDDIISDNLMNKCASISLTQERNSLIVPHFSFHYMKDSVHCIIQWFIPVEYCNTET